MEGDEIDFSGIDEDLEQFQQDDIVRQALRDGVDLRGYARDIDLELREVRPGPMRARRLQTAVYAMTAQPNASKFTAVLQQSI